MATKRRQGRGSATAPAVHTRVPHGASILLPLALLMILAASPAAAQHSVTGRVTDAETGAGLAGVQISIPGTALGTLSSVDGRYQINAPSPTAVLSFTRLGYAPQQVPIESRTEINVQLASSAVELEGIVAIGYGEARRATLTESVGVVQASEIQRTTVASPDQAIQGRVSGVQVTTESGIPGAPVAMRVRGVGTVGNSQPLFVVDGVPVGKGTAGTSSPLATINPNDIESISVLKDASAASVYGMQAANGVVLIQTKRGQLGRPTIQYDGYYGVQRFPGYYNMNDASSWLALEREAIDAENAYFNRDPGSADYVLQHPDLREGSSVLPQLLARNTDWTRIGIHNNAPITNHNVAISGAGEGVSYYVSGGFYQQDAIVDKWDLRRFSFRANSEFDVTSWFRLGENFSVSNQSTLRGAANYGDGTILNNLLQQPPIFLAHDPALVSPTNPDGLTGNYLTGGFARPNLNSTNQLVDVTDRVTRVLGSVFGEVDLVEGLTLRSQNSVDYGISNQYFWQPSLTNEMTGFARAEIAEDIRGDNYTLVSTNTANYTNTFGNHGLELLGGLETNISRGNSLSLQTSGFVNTQYELRRIVSLGDQVLKKGGGASEVNRVGYFGRLNYQYDDKYLLTATVRRDGVSTFAPGNQWGTFPAFSVGWRLTEEPWFNVSWIDELKLRGGWGQLGNSEIIGGEYPQYLSVLLWADYEIGGQVQLAPTPQPRLANAGLSWETNETTDVGVETILLDGRADLAVTYYRRDTKDFLLGIPVPILSGFTSAPVNVGSVRNSGWELQAGYNTVLANDLQLGISANLTTVNNELVSLTDGVYEYQQDDVYRTEVGRPIGFFYGYETCGVHQSDAAASAIPDNTTGGNAPRAGDMCFRDLRGGYERDDDGRPVETPPDNQITVADRTYLGKTIPDAYYGINLNAVFRNFDVTAFFTGVTGVQAYNLVRRNLESMAGGGGNQLASTANRWTPDQPGNTMPRAIGSDPADNTRFSDRWVEDADYFRLKTLQVGYTLPAGLLGANVRNTRLYLSATNLWTVTDYSGLDPEFTTRGNAFNAANNQSQLGARTDDGNVPQPRMFQIGVSTTF